MESNFIFCHANVYEKKIKRGDANNFFAIIDTVLFAVFPRTTV